jgi:acylphosphatase
LLVKANIRVYGNVQAVGYRVFVKSVARLMSIRGLVRNLEDGSIEVFAEAEEVLLEKFLEAIDVKDRPGDMLSLNVERIEVRREGEPGYTGPWREYSLFETDYGEEVVRPVEREIVESLEWVKLYFTKLVSEFTDYREEFRKFRDESLKISSETLNEARELMRDLKVILDERSVKIEKDIAETKARLGLL